MKKYRILPLLLIVCLLLTAAFPAAAAKNTADNSADTPQSTANVSSDGVPQSTVQAQEGSYVFGSDAVKSALDEKLQANCVLLADEDSGQYYYTRNIDAKAYPASLTKIMTLLLAVEAGERLGFLPGDLQNKVDPYLRPLYDALFEMLGADAYAKYLERGNIEVAPLAYMRGRTLDDSFIILDEAQNTSREQMKMFLTRIGFGSHVVITGDVTQIDLPADKMSGLKQAVRVLKDVEGIGICELTDQDVVRHVMVQRIIEAYAKFEEKKV